MRGSHAGPRVLLRRLREVMAESVSVQERLDKIVVLIAANMVAEVCSVYVLRADGVLELYATEGLNHTAVHNTGLHVGEGLVGQIAATAESLNLSTAQSHPAFVYRPETGEEVYNAFLGVPILRAGRTLGVLVVQNRAHRSYTEEEIEALQTTSMVLAEMVASGELSTITAPGLDLDLTKPANLQGIALADGVGLGYVVLHEPRVVVTNMLADDPDNEIDRLDHAIAKLRLSVDDMLSRGEVAHHGEHRDVLEAFRMFAYDRGWVRRMREVIEAGLTAEAAVERVQSDTRARLIRQKDPFIRERLNDFDDLGNRLLRELMGEQQFAAAELPKDAVLVARSMGAAELLDYDRKHLRGLVLEEGGPTSHVTIIARALGIPVVGQTARVASYTEQGDAIIIDGERGEIFLRPASDVQNAYAERVRFRARRQEQYRALRDEPAITSDGASIELQLNAGLLVDLPHLKETGAAGIGLFRTELQFMVASILPRMRTLFDFYSQVIEVAGERSVTFRTLDIGGDKVLPFMRSQPEENPAMGWRAIRLGLDRPGLLRIQMRALLRASAGRRLKIMFPMISLVTEFDQAKALLDKEVHYLRKHGYETPDTILTGAMIEVPSLLYDLPALMRRCDFVCVGSNDLFQFIMASDRSNTHLANRFDVLSVPFLRALQTIIEVADDMNTPVTLCGEIAGRPLEAIILLGLGYRSLSMSPASIGPVKAAIRMLNLSDASTLLETMIARECKPHDIRHAFAGYFNENIGVLGNTLN